MIYDMGKHLGLGWTAYSSTIEAFDLKFSVLVFSR